MNSETLKTAPAERREWWRREAARVGSNWNAVMDLRISVAPLACGICGAVPCANPSFCAACRVADQQQPRLAQREVEHRPTPQTTIEAILYCVKARGQSALQEPANLERLSRCDAAALAQNCRAHGETRTGSPGGTMARVSAPATLITLPPPNPAEHRARRPRTDAPSTGGRESPCGKAQQADVLGSVPRG
jgi:hypothetical protein